MSATVTIKRNFDSLTELDLVTREDMREIGLLARERIVTRTREGLDASLQPFAPYSEAYEAQKQAALGHANVDLQVSGNMLNHLGIVDVTENTVTLGWAQ